MTTGSPTRSELDARHLQFCTDSDYLNSIWPQVREKYQDEYVAVYRGKIVAEHADLKQVLIVLKEKGVPSNHTVIRFVSKKPRRMIL